MPFSQVSTESFWYVTRLFMASSSERILFSAQGRDASFPEIWGNQIYLINVTRPWLELRLSGYIFQRVFYNWDSKGKHIFKRCFYASFRLIENESPSNITSTWHLCTETSSQQGLSSRLFARVGLFVFYSLTLSLASGIALQDDVRKVRVSQSSVRNSHWWSLIVQLEMRVLESTREPTERIVEREHLIPIRA